MLVAFLLSCQPTAADVAVEDLDGVHWEGEFA
jgi:hypothetical protein